MGINSGFGSGDDYDQSPINQVKDLGHAGETLSRIPLDMYNLGIKGPPALVTLFTRNALKYTVGVGYKGAQLGLKGVDTVLEAPNKFLGGSLAA